MAANPTKHVAGARHYDQSSTDAIGSVTLTNVTLTNALHHIVTVARKSYAGPLNNVQVLSYSYDGQLHVESYCSDI